MARALSSEVSWRILDLLMADQSGVPEISRALDTQPEAVELHLEKLLEAGIVAAQEKTLPSGEVTLVYRLTGVGRSVGFPPRNYLFMSEALINSLRSSLGEDGARVTLRDMGIHIGENAAQALLSRTKPTKWDPATYAEHFVNGLMREMGFYPMLVRVGRDRVVYQERNCLFQDLAVKSPGLVCDILDEAVHEGFDKSLGGMKSIRLKCKGHGDPVCEFRVQWGASPRGRGARSKSEARKMRRNAPGVRAPAN